MNSQQIKQELKMFLLNSFRVKKLSYSDNIFETGAMHSLFFIQLLIFIEKKFKIDLEVGDFDPKRLTTIDAIAEFILTKLKVAAL